MCTDIDDDGRIYRWVSDELRPYPNGRIATSWNPYWKREIKFIQCDDLLIGNPMEMKIVLK
jgi:hypothetical protein